MYKLGLLFLCAVAYFCNAQLLATANKKIIFSLDEVKKLFEDFIKIHGKVYSDEAEKNMRFEIFKQNLLKINKNNANPENHAEFGINRFADLTQEEFLQQYTGLLSANTEFDGIERRMAEEEFVNAPSEFDWRDKNAVTRVKDQGLCDSCWAFSTTGTVEGAYAIKHKKLVEVSEQQLIDCDTEDFGCRGGNMLSALGYFQEKGAELESDYKYTAKNGNCKFNKHKVAVNVTGYKVYAPESEDKLKNILVTAGPLSIAVDGSTLQMYKKGIISNCTFNRLNLALLLVGYGTDNNVPYWTIKNSLGTEYGESGYVRVKRGVNACGMMNMVMLAADVA